MNYIVLIGLAPTLGGAIKELRGYVEKRAEAGWVLEGGVSITETHERQFCAAQAMTWDAATQTKET